MAFGHERIVVSTFSLFAIWLRIQGLRFESRPGHKMLSLSGWHPSFPLTTWRSYWWYLLDLAVGEGAACPNCCALRVRLLVKEWLKHDMIHSLQITSSRVCARLMKIVKSTQYGGCAQACSPLATQSCSGWIIDRSEGENSVAADICEITIK